MGVNVKSTKSPQTSNFRIDDKGEVLSIKFDPNFSILSLQRKRNCVEFINFSNGRPEDLAYSRSSKKSASIIIGFVWSSDSEIIFVTNEGFELYQVNRELRTTKALKHGSVQTNWYNWDPLSKTLLLSTGELGNRLYVTCFENGTVVKLPSFEVPEEEILPLSHGPSSNTTGETKKLQQKDCLLANLYGQLYACILSKGAYGGVNLVLYQLMRRGTVKRRHILVVPEVGRIALTFVRDLVLVHHQHSRTSLAYDIAALAAGDPVNEGDSDGPKLHYPLLPPVSLEDVCVSCKDIPALSHEPSAEFSTPLYAPSWIVFPPNVVIDGSLGCLWTVDLNLDAFTTLISDPIVLVNCLLNREGAKPVLRHYCQDLVEKLVQSFIDASSDEQQQSDNGPTHQMEVIYQLLVRFADIQKSARGASKHRRAHQNQARGQVRSDSDRTVEVAEPEPIQRPYKPPLVFTPDDVYETMFVPLTTYSSDNPKVLKILSHLIFHYVTELKSRSLIVDPMFFSLLMECLIKSNDFSRLMYLLRSGVIVDSTKIANQLLSFESVFPPASQLALDMLQRLGTSNESIVEIFLAKGDPIMALRFCKEHPELLPLPETPRKILDAAKLCEDPMIFYSVFRFFERAVPFTCSLMQDPKYKPYTSKFVELFGAGSLVLSNN
nr:Colon cancer associated Mic1 [Hymenolepis microstoma]